MSGPHAAAVAGGLICLALLVVVVLLIGNGRIGRLPGDDDR